LRLILAQNSNVSDLVTQIAKLAFVALLVSSWPAYKILVYDLVLDGPSQISQIISSSAALPGQDGSLFGRLQAADTAINQLALTGSGYNGLSALQADGQASSVPLIVTDDTALAVGKTAFLLGILASFGIIRLFGGILLALAPLFAIFLLFRPTTGLFVGWVKALLAIFVGSVLTSLILAVQLAFLEGWLSDVLLQRSNRIATPDAPFELMAMSMAFSIILFASLYAAFRLSFSSAATILFQQARLLLGSRDQGSRDYEAPMRMDWVTSGARPLVNRIGDTGGQSYPATQLAANRRAGIYTALAQARDNTETNTGDIIQPLRIPLGQTYRRSTPGVARSARRRDNM
jgi:type IV secretion system protein VirB6